ncbi:MAG: hypothetical protein HOD92_21335 [Deltaproteobacteria bacterium]|nr:hypothetical protein [Deltaproteobacteria bacterium]
MKKKEFIVTGGFLDNSSEGYIGKIILAQLGEGLSINYELIKIMEPPDENLRIKNKGFSGASINKNKLWVCTANQVLAFSLDDFEIEQTINDPLFNDLHYVLAEDDGLHVVNTGLESLDYFDYDGKLKLRTLLTSDKRTEFRTRSVPDFRIIDSNPHFMHANYCSRHPDGQLLLTFLRQRRIVNTTDWSWGSPLYSAPPHEGFVEYFHPVKKDCLWITTVPGEVIACDPSTYKEVARWSLIEKGIPPGWTRGLCILEKGFLVGTTKITTSNADYYSDWGKADLGTSHSCVSYIPFESTQSKISCKILNQRIAKVFSIIPLH